MSSTMQAGDGNDEDKTPGAMHAALRRICTPKPTSGRLEVSTEIYRQWKAGGQQRKCLLDTLVKAKGDKDRGMTGAQHRNIFRICLKFQICGHDVCVLPYIFFLLGVPERKSSRSKLSTSSRSLAVQMYMLKKVSTPRNKWKQIWNGNRPCLSFFSCLKCSVVLM